LKSLERESQVDPLENVCKRYCESLGANEKQSLETMIIHLAADDKHELIIGMRDLILQQLTEEHIRVTESLKNVLGFITTNDNNTLSETIWFEKVFPSVLQMKHTVAALKWLEGH